MLIAEVGIILLLIAINGALAMSELAVVSSRRSRLETMVEQGVHGSRRALALASRPGRFLSTVQIGITLVGVLAGAYSGATIGVRFADWLSSEGVSWDIARPIAVSVVIAAITYLSLVVGELVPKQLALRRPEILACAVAPAMTWLAQIASPFVWLLDHSSKKLLALLGQHELPETKVTEEEIKTLVAEAERAGVVEPEERAMIAGIMRLGDRPVGTVMTPRHAVDLIDLSDSLEAIKTKIVNSRHSRLPVCDGTPDEIMGIIQAKDLLDGYIRGDVVEPRAFVRSAPVLPESIDALDALGILKDSAVHMGLVHDEYGHFQGIVTSADILEAIVGQFRTEQGFAEPHFVRRDDGSYLIAGSAAVDELVDVLGIDLPAQRTYHTVAGLVLSELGRMSGVGDSVRINGWRFEVVDLDGRRIDKLLVSRPTNLRRAAS